MESRPKNEYRAVTSGIRFAGSTELLFDDATRFDTLWAAWEKVAANNGAAGGDGVSVAHFQRDAHNRISRLSHALRSGRYRPGQVRRVMIPKRSGGKRPLHIPPVADRIAQGAVALTLQPLLEPEFEDASFGYRPGRSVAQAVARVAALRRQGYRTVVDGDIVRYFERVPHERLITTLERHVADTRLVDLVGLWLEHHDGSGIGLPQGSPLSPLLANLYLDAVDEAIEGRGVRLVRFADDFVLLCKSETVAVEALARMAALLGEHGLELHPGKTRVVPFDEGFRFLGHVFVRSMVWREVLAEEERATGLVEAAERALATAPAEEGDEDAEAAEADAAPQRGRHAPGWRVMHLVEPGRRLDAEREIFVVRDGEATLLRLPATRVDRIEVHPACETSPAALELAAAGEVEVVRVGAGGRTIGRWSGPAPARAARQLVQAAAVLDPARRGRLAVAIVAARIANQRALVRRLDRTRHDGELDRAAVQLGRTMRKLNRAGLTAAQAMGHEGEAAAIYWPALARCLPDGWGWRGRRARRGNEDPFNILLDCMASLLLRDVATALGRTGLHPGFALLHAADDGEEALVWDLAEEFRGPVAEASVLAGIARGQFRLEMFARQKDGAWYMGREGWPAVVRTYEGWVARPIRDPASGETVLWRTLMARQAERLAEAFETDAYRPYRMDY